MDLRSFDRRIPMGTRSYHRIKENFWLPGIQCYIACCFERQRELVQKHVRLINDWLPSNAQRAAGTPNSLDGAQPLFTFPSSRALSVIFRQNLSWLHLGLSLVLASLRRTMALAPPKTSDRSSRSRWRARPKVSSARLIPQPLTSNLRVT